MVAVARGAVVGGTVAGRGRGWRRKLAATRGPIKERPGKSGQREGKLVQQGDWLAPSGASLPVRLRRPGETPLNARKGRESEK